MERVSLIDLQSACDRILQEAVHNVRQKYRSDRYVRRLDAESSFDQFIRSDKKLFLMLGDSGKGKTNLMCHFALISAQIYPTLLLTGMWREHPTERILDHVFNRLKIDLGQEAVDTWNFVRNLSDLLAETKSQFLIIIDGINETTDYQWVKNGFRELLSKCPDTIRFAISSRTDSFRLHFQDSFWADYVYQAGSKVIEEKEDEQYALALDAVARSRYERIITPEQKRIMETALRDHRDEVRRAKAEQLKSLATGGSIFIKSFSDAEFAEALVKYKTSASLVGEARENCYDPLIFRFFADTIGQEAREVSDVFTLENARQYLNKHILEVEAQSYGRDDIYTLLYQIANNGRKQSRSLDRSVAGSSLASESDMQLAERFVETGLLTWRQWLPDGRRRAIAFSFDRMLSFVLALEASNGGSASIYARLQEIAKDSKPSVIDIHQSSYLLLFHDELYGDTAEPENKDWIQVFLKKPLFRSQIVQLLPELNSWSADKIIEEVHALLLQLTDGNAKHRIRRPWRSDNLSGNLMEACANALSAVARKGHGLEVISMVEEFIHGSLKDERTERFFFLVRPIAVAFDFAPDRCIKLLEQVCESESETKEEVPIFYYGSSSTGLDVLVQEIRNFPSARLPVIHQLAVSQWATLRAICAVALPGLFFTDADEAEALLSRLIDDNDNLVRARIAEIIPDLAKNNTSVALDLCARLIEDKDIYVRRALVHAAVILTCQGQSTLDSLLKSALGDESPKIRATLARSTAQALSGPEVKDGVEKLLQSILEILAKDQSNYVRLAVILAARDLLPSHPRFSIQLMLAAVKDNTPPALKEAVINCLKNDKAFSELLVEELDELATLLAKDADYTVRIQAIDLLVIMADYDSLRAKELLIELADDPEVHVRLAVLQHQRTRKSFSEIIPKIGKDVYIDNLRRKDEVCQWINALAAAKIEELSRRDIIERFLRNVGVASLLIPLLAFLGVKSWAISWLGQLEDGTSSADPRLSFAPILLGIFVAVLIANIQRWLDLHYYSHYAGFLFKRIWPYIITPMAVSITAALFSLICTTTQLALLIGIAALTLSMLVSLSMTERAYNRFSEPWFGASAAWIIGVGYISGALAGWFAEATKEGFYGLSMLLCPLLLNLRIAPKLREILSRILGIGLLASLLPLIVYFINKWHWLAGSHLAQWMEQSIAPMSGETIIITCLLLVGVALVVADSGSSDAEMAFFSGGVTFLILLFLIWPLSHSFAEAMLIALLVGEVIWLVIIASTERPALWQALLILCGSYLIIHEGGSMATRPWLLPSVAILVTGIYAIAWWALPEEYDPYRMIEGGAPEPLLKPSPARIAILMACIALPFLCGLTIALKASVGLSPLPQFLNSQVGSVLVSSIFVGLMTSHLFFGLNLLTAVAKRLLIGFVVGVLIMGSIFVLLNNERGIFGAVALLAIGNGISSIRYGLRVAGFLPIVFASAVLPAGVILLAIWSKSVYVGYGIAFVLVWVVLIIARKIRPEIIAGIAEILSGDNQERRVRVSRYYEGMGV